MFILRGTSLVILTIQNAALILIMRYARTRTGDMFYSTTAVVMAEVFKTTGCLLIISCQEGGFSGLMHHLNRVKLNKCHIYIHFAVNILCRFNRAAVAVWLSGNTLVSINKVTLRWARLVLGWVTVCGLVNHLGM